MVAQEKKEVIEKYIRLNLIALELLPLEVAIHPRMISPPLLHHQMSSQTPKRN